MRQIGATLLVGLLAMANPSVARPPDKVQAQAAIWALEQSIYAARGRGDMGPYQAGLARDYLAWPPFRATPAGAEGIASLQRTMVTENKEVLTMEFVGFAMNGDAAVIYYQTHRSRLPNGTEVDERFEVTHSWVWQDGRWKVMGGMARATPKR